MEQPIKIEATLEGRMLRTIGSFWSSVFREKEQVRVLLEAGLRTTVLGSFNQSVQNLAGDVRLGSLVRHVFVPFEQNDVIETGAQVYDSQSIMFAYGEYTDAPTAFGDYRIKYWALPLTTVMPISIQALDRQLLIGVDFFIQAGRFIYFRQDPRTLFPPGAYLVVRGYDLSYRSYISFFTQTQSTEHEDLVTNYFRGMQTPQNFKLAMAAVGGLGIIRKGGKLLSIAQTGNNTSETIYVFADEVVRVNYGHEPLQLGATYAPLTVIGDIIQVFQADRRQTAWWRQLNWRGGLTLDPLIPGARSMSLPDAWTYAYSAGQDVGSAGGSKVHAQLKLSPDFYLEKEYWDRVRVAETRTGHYLNSVLGLAEEVEDSNPTSAETYDKLLAATEAANVLNLQLGYPLETPDVASLPGAKLVNALDVFFQAALDQVGMVIAFDQKRLDRQKQVFDFLAREMPIGGCPVIIGFVPDVIDDFDRFDSEIEVSEVVSTSAALLTQVVEEVDGSTLGGETVTIVPQLPIL